MIEAHASDCMAESADVPTAKPSNSRWSSSRQSYNAHQESSISIMDEQQRPPDISSRERRQQKLDRLASQRRRRTPTPAPTLIVDETYSDIEEYSDDNGTNELKTCLICGAAIPAQDIEQHIDEELNAMEQKGQQQQDQQSSAEPRSSSSMADLRDSFRDNVMVLSDADDSGSDSDGVVDLSGPGPIPVDHDNGSNHYYNNNNDDNDDDGYLSPLEGFESINPQDHPQYYNQGTRQTSSSSSRQQLTPGASSSTAPKRRRGTPRQGRGSRRTPAQNRAIHAKRARGQSKGGGGSKKPKASRKPKGKK